MAGAVQLGIDDDLAQRRGRGEQLIELRQVVPLHLGGSARVWSIGGGKYADRDAVPREGAQGRVQLETWHRDEGDALSRTLLVR